MAFQLFIHGEPHTYTNAAALEAFLDAEATLRDHDVQFHHLDGLRPDHVAAFDLELTRYRPTAIKFVRGTNMDAFFEVFGGALTNFDSIELVNCEFGDRPPPDPNVQYVHIRTDADSVERHVLRPLRFFGRLLKLRLTDSNTVVNTAIRDQIRNMNIAELILEGRRYNLNEMSWARSETVRIEFDAYDWDPDHVMMSLPRKLMIDVDTAHDNTSYVPILRFFEALANVVTRTEHYVRFVWNGMFPSVSWLDRMHAAIIRIRPLITIDFRLGWYSRFLDDMRPGETPAPPLLEDEGTVALRAFRAMLRNRNAINENFAWITRPLGIPTPASTFQGFDGDHAVGDRILNSLIQTPFDRESIEREVFFEYHSHDPLRVPPMAPQLDAAPRAAGGACRTYRLKWR